MIRRVVLACLCAELAALPLAGCSSSSGGTTPTGPPPGSIAEVESNDYVPQAVGTLGTTDLVVAGTISGDADVDLFKVTVADSTNLAVSLDWSTTADLSIGISNRNGIMVRAIDSASHPEQCTIAAVPPGGYTLRVGTRTNAATAYTLTIGARPLAVPQ